MSKIINWDRKLETPDGRPARLLAVLCTSSKYRYVVVVTGGNGEWVRQVSKYGYDSGATNEGVSCPIVCNVPLTAKRPSIHLLTHRHPETGAIRVATYSSKYRENLAVGEYGPIIDTQLINSKIIQLKEDEA